MKYLLGAALMAALVVPLSSAQADPPPWAPAHGKRAKDRAIYDSYGRYYEPRRHGYDDYVWRGRDGQYYCRRDHGTAGLYVGPAVGALAARDLEGGRDRTAATNLVPAG